MAKKKETSKKTTPTKYAKVADTPTKYAKEVDTPTKYAKEVDTPTKYAKEVDTPTKYAKETDTPTKYAKEVDTPTKYAKEVDTPTKYAKETDTPTKYAKTLAESEGTFGEHQNRRLFEASVEEVLLSFNNMINRLYPDATEESKINLLNTLVSKYGNDSIKVQKDLISKLMK